MIGITFLLGTFQMQPPNPPTKPKGINARQLQKVETQRKLLAAARSLAQAGKMPSITEVAKEAKVSVATAYRYYSDPQRLQSDAALDMSLDQGQPDFVQAFEDAAAGATDPLERLLIAQRHMMGTTIEHEAAYRLFVAKGHEEIVRDGLKRRKRSAGGRRILMIEAALKDIQAKMHTMVWLEMVHGLMIVMGPEPFFILKDFADQSDEQIQIIVERTIGQVFMAHWRP